MISFEREDNYDKSPNTFHTEHCTLKYLLCMLNAGEGLSDRSKPFRPWVFEVDLSILDMSTDVNNGVFSLTSKTEWQAV